MKPANKFFILLPLLAFAVAGVGCLQQPVTQPQPAAPSQETIIEECIQACKAALAQGKDLINGPCLLNPMPKNSEWVCDVAHFPREEVDNNPMNQCSAYGEKLAAHFVEVTPECGFIKAV